MAAKQRLILVEAEIFLLSRCLIFLLWISTRKDDGNRLVAAQEDNIIYGSLSHSGSVLSQKTMCTCWSLSYRSENYCFYFLSHIVVLPQLLLKAPSSTNHKVFVFRTIGLACNLLLKYQFPLPTRSAH